MSGFDISIARSRFVSAAKQIAADLGIEGGTINHDADDRDDDNNEFFWEASGAGVSGLPSFVLFLQRTYVGSDANREPSFHVSLEVSYAEYTKPFEFDMDITATWEHPGLVRWAAWAIHNFRLRHDPTKLESLFRDDYIRVCGVPKNRFPTLTELQLLMRGLQASNSSVAILKFRHVSVTDWYRSYSYAIWAETLARGGSGLWVFFCDASGLDSGGAHGDYEFIEELIRDLGKRVTVKHYDVEYPVLERFLLRKGRSFNSYDYSFSLESLHRSELDFLEDEFGDEIAAVFCKSENSFWDRDYPGALRDLRAVVQDALVYVAKAWSVGLEEVSKPNIYQIAQKLIKTRVLDTRLAPWFEAFSSFANIASHGNFPSENDWKDPNTRARVLATFVIGRQLLLEMKYCLDRHAQTEPQPENVKRLRRLLSGNE